MKKERMLRQRRSGFTLMETLIAVAIVLILAAVAFIAAPSLNDRLEQEDLDAKAQMYYTVVQARMTELRTTGRTSVYRNSPTEPVTGATRMPDDYRPIDLSDDIEFISEEMCYIKITDYSSELARQLIPEGQLDREIADGYAVIEYNFVSGTVYGIFYSKDASVIEKYKPEDYNNLRKKDNRSKNDPAIGYYGSGSTTIHEIVTIDPRIEIVNGERLYAKLIIDKEQIEKVSGFRGKKITFKWKIQQLDAENQPIEGLVVEGSLPAEKSGDHYETEFTLDGFLDVKQDTIYKQFEQLGKDADVELEPGQRMQLSVRASSSEFDSTRYTKAFNSLFDEASTSTEAVITCARHLQNLRYAGKSITSARLAANIDFGAGSAWKKEYPSRRFVPITGTGVNKNLSELTGKGENGGTYAIRNLEAEPEAGETTAGLFGTIENITIEDIRLTNPKVTGKTYAGALAGRLLGNSTVKNCCVDNPAVKLTDTGSAGGLIGSMSGSTVILSESAPGDFGITAPVISIPSGSAGGVVGTVETGGSGAQISNGTVSNLTIECGTGGSCGGVVGETASGLTVDGMDVTDAKIDARQGGRVGGIVGSAGDTLTVKKCRCLLEKRLPVFTLDQENPKKLAEYESMLDGGSASGGLIGNVANGVPKVSVTNSYAATVLGSDKCETAGGLIGMSAGQLEVRQSYADCYCFGKCAAGLVADIAKGGNAFITNAYAAGYLFGSQMQAGLAYSSNDAPVAFANCYTVVMPQTDTGKNYYSTANNVYEDPTGATNTYFSMWSFGTGKNSPVTTKMKTPEYKDHEYFKNQLGEAFTLGEVTYPYKLMGQTTLENGYPMPMLMGDGTPQHFGDWEYNELYFNPGFVYFEKYLDPKGTDGFSFGVCCFDDTELSTLRDDLPIVGDGYGLLLMDSMGDVNVLSYTTSDVVGWERVPNDGDSEKGVTYNAAKQSTATFPVFRDAADGLTICAFPINVVNENSSSGGNMFYQKYEITFDKDTTKTYFCNPRFAKCAVEAEECPAIEGEYAIRTARQLYMMGDLYYIYSADVKEGDRTTFVQERDIDFAQTAYDWATFTPEGLYQGGLQPIGTDKGKFNATYDGRGHSITNATLIDHTRDAADNLRGLFGVISAKGTVRNVVLVNPYASMATVNYAQDKAGTIRYGALAAVTEETSHIENCAVNGFSVRIPKASAKKAMIGGFVGSNAGTIRNCSCVAPSISVLPVTDGSVYSVGGFAGEHIAGGIQNCYAFTTIDVEVRSGITAKVGGFAGNATAVIRDSYCASSNTNPSANDVWCGFAPVNGEDNANCYYIEDMYFLRFCGKEYRYASDDGARERSMGKSVRPTAVPMINGFAKAQNVPPIYHDIAKSEEFPFPAVVKVNNVVTHYGDWPVTTMAKESKAFFVYYEQYKDGSDGIDYLYDIDNRMEVSWSMLHEVNAGSSRPADYGTVTADGYGILVNGTEKPVVKTGASGTVQNAFIELKIDDVNTLYLFDPSWADVPEEKGVFFTKLTVSVGASGESTFYSNLRSGKSFSGTNLTGAAATVYIRSPRQLYALGKLMDESIYAANYAKGAKFVQSLDLDYAAYNWTKFQGAWDGRMTAPAGYSMQKAIGAGTDRPFDASYNGNGHTIKNLYFERSRSNMGGEDKYYLALFGALGATGRVENLQLDTVSCNPADAGIPSNGFAYTGALVGNAAEGAAVSNCSVKNVTLDTSVLAADTNRVRTGALIGMSSGTVSGCSAESSTIKGKGDTGGLIGDVVKGSVSGCTVTGVTVTSTAKNAGGVAGLVSTGSTLDITDCEVTECELDGDVSCGGIVGQTTMTDNGRIVGCVVKNNSKIQCSGGQAGGIVGISGISITGCRSESNTVRTTGSNKDAGGIAGKAHKNIADCEAVNNAVTGVDCAGGIVGYMESAFTVSNCTVTGGTVTTGNKAGGIFGYVSKANGKVTGGSVSGVTVSATSASGIAGGAVGTNSGTVENVSVGTVTVSVNNTNVQVGGVVGNNGGTIKNCTVSGSNGKVTLSSTGAGAKVGGIVGHNDNTVKDCTIANADITASGSGAIAGGLFGQNSGTAAYTVNTGRADVNNCTVTGSQYTGGAAGANSVTLSGINVKNSTVKGTETVGGIAGSNSGSISGMRLSSTAVKGGSAGTGGFVGSNSGTLKESVSTLVSISETSGDVGGLVANNAAGATVTNCAAGRLSINSGSKYVGGAIGKNYGTVTKCGVNAEINATMRNISAQIAGFVASAQKNSLIDACYTASVIEGTSTGKAAGFVGEQTAINLIKNSYTATAIKEGNWSSRSGFSNTSYYCSNCYYLYDIEKWVVFFYGYYYHGEELSYRLSESAIVAKDLEFDELVKKSIAGMADVTKTEGSELSGNYPFKSGVQINGAYYHNGNWPTKTAEEWTTKVNAPMMMAAPKLMLSAAAPSMKNGELTLPEESTEVLYITATDEDTGDVVTEGVELTVTSDSEAVTVSEAPLADDFVDESTGKTVGEMTDPKKGEYAGAIAFAVKGSSIGDAVLTVEQVVPEERTEEARKEDEELAAALGMETKQSIQEIADELGIKLVAVEEAEPAEPVVIGAKVIDILHVGIADGKAVRKADKAVDTETDLTVPQDPAESEGMTKDETGYAPYSVGLPKDKDNLNGEFILYTTGSTRITLCAEEKIAALKAQAEVAAKTGTAAEVERINGEINAIEAGFVITRIEVVDHARVLDETNTEQQVYVDRDIPFIVYNAAEDSEPDSTNYRFTFGENTWHTVGEDVVNYLPVTVTGAAPDPITITLTLERQGTAVKLTYGMEKVQNEFRVTFREGENILSEETVPFGAFVNPPELEIPATGDEEGYVYPAGYIPGESVWTNDPTEPIYADTEFRTLREPITYTVCLESYGGEGKAYSMELTYNETVRLPSEPFRRRGYQLVGWSLMPGEEVAFEDGAEICNLATDDGERVTLFAVWEKDA